MSIFVTICNIREEGGGRRRGRGKEVPSEKWKMESSEFQVEILNIEQIYK